MRFLIGLAATLTLAIVFTPSASAQSDIGYVYEISGNWYLNNRRLLSPFDVVYASNLITNRTPNGKVAVIRIMGRGGKPLLNEKCSEKCSFKLPDAAPPSNRSTASWIVAAVASTWRRAPKRYSLARSRNNILIDAFDKKLIKSGVIKLDRNTIHIGAQINLREKAYLQIRRIPLDPKEREGDWSKEIEIATDKTSVVLTSKVFVPGIYEFRLSKMTSNGLLPIDSAWLLLSQDPDFEKDARSFVELTAWIESLGDEISFETAVMFSNVFLGRLANENAEK